MEQKKGDEQGMECEEAIDHSEGLDDGFELSIYVSQSGRIIIKETCMCFHLVMCCLF
jgi:hypothetical protein